MTSTITRPTVADILTQAADLLEERGWCQNRAEDRDGHFCAVGALDAALGVVEPYLTLGGLFSEAVRALRAHIGTSVVCWNDAPGRTADEVIGLLRRAAAQLEAQA